MAKKQIVDDAPFIEDDISIPSDEDHFNDAYDDIIGDDDVADNEHAIDKTDATLDDDKDLGHDILEDYHDDVTDAVSPDNAHNDISTSELIVTDSLKDSLSNSMCFTLSCEVGSINLSITELGNLKVGDSLELVSDLQQIKIKVNSVVVGFGALVDVDGRYGIKITKILTMTEQLNS